MKYVKIMDMDGGKCLAIDATEGLKLRHVDAEGKFFVDEGKYRWVIVPECGEVEEVDSRTAAKIITAAEHSVPFYAMAVMAADYISDGDKIVFVYDMACEESGVGTCPVEDDADFGPGVWLGWMRMNKKEKEKYGKNLWRVAVAHTATVEGRKHWVLRGYDLYAIAKATGFLRDFRLWKEEN